MRQHGAAQGCVGRALVFGTQRRDDTNAFGVGLLTELVHHRAARHLGHVFGVHIDEAGAAQHEPRGQCFLALGFGDGAGALHAPQHPFLALARSGCVGHRVGVNGVLRQAREHGDLGRGQRGQWLAEVHLRGGAKAVGALAQVDLVEVQLQDLVLAELPFQLHRDQRFLDLAFTRAAGAEEKGARHLLGDGGSTLRRAAFEVGPGGAHQAAQADAAMFVKARVFHREHGLLQGLRHLCDRQVQTPFAAELGNLHAVGRQHLQVLARPVVGGLVQRWQVVPVPPCSGGQRQHGGCDHAQRQQEQGAQDDEATRPGRRHALGPGGHGSNSNSAVPSARSDTSLICG